MISKIKNLIKLKEDYIIWLKEFKNSLFYEFHYIFKNVFDNESPIRENTSNLINNSTTLLIISNIICFWIVDKNAFNNFIKDKNNHKDIKNLYELMINNHILYLLLCLFILIEANLINDKKNVYVLRLIEQIRVYMSKILRNFKNRILVLSEIKSVSKNIINTLKNILLQNNYISQELYYYINNINKVDVLRLFKILEEIKIKNDLEYDKIHINNNANNINNNINILYNEPCENKNYFSKRNYYKQLNKANKIKKNHIGNGLYIKKSIPNKQMNNSEVTNKIINIIINNNITKVKYDNQNKNHFSINYNNLNKNNKIDNNINNYSSNNFEPKLKIIMIFINQ